MPLSLSCEQMRVFSVSPRPRHAVPQAYWPDVQAAIAWSDAYGCTGMLIFVANDSPVDPWLVAVHGLATTTRFSPLVAVNPVYMHPFSAARMVSSLSNLYGRRIYLNMVTGTAASHLQALNDSLTHDDRYARLGEYIALMTRLLSAREPISFAGSFYGVTRLQLLPPVPTSLFPEFLLAGQSDAARAIGERLGVTRMQILQPTLHDGVQAQGIYFGLVTRETDEAAQRAAHRLFPDAPEGRAIVEASLGNTDSVWKHRLGREASTEIAASGYWLGPFHHNQADAPFFVGSHRRAAALIASLAERGVDTVILELGLAEEEYDHASNAFALARRARPDAVVASQP